MAGAPSRGASVSDRPVLSSLLSGRDTRGPSEGQREPGGNVALRPSCGGRAWGGAGSGFLFKDEGGPGTCSPPAVFFCQQCVESLVLSCLVFDGGSSYWCCFLTGEKCSKRCLTHSGHLINIPLSPSSINIY